MVMVDIALLFGRIIIVYRQDEFVFDKFQILILNKSNEQVFKSKFKRDQWLIGAS